MRCSGVLMADLPRSGQGSISLSEWRRFVRVADWFDRTHGQLAGVVPAFETPPSDIVIVQNDTGDDRRRGDVVGIGDKLLTDLTANKLWFSGETPAATHSTLGVLLDPIKDGKRGRAQVSGVCLAYVDFDATTDQGASFSPGNYVFASQADGPIQILTAPASTSEQLVAVLLGRASDDLVVKTPSGGIAARSSTTVNSALCDVYRETGTGSTRTLTAVTSTQVRVFNFSNAAVGGSRYVVTSCTRWGTRYVVVESCTAES